MKRTTVVPAPRRGVEHHRADDVGGAEEAAGPDPPRRGGDAVAVDPAERRARRDHEDDRADEERDRRGRDRPADVVAELGVDCELHGRGEAGRDCERVQEPGHGAALWHAWRPPRAEPPLSRRTRELSNSSISRLSRAFSCRCSSAESAEAIDRLLRRLRLDRFAVDAAAFVCQLDQQGPTVVRSGSRRTRPAFSSPSSRFVIARSRAPAACGSLRVRVAGPRCAASPSRCHSP